jgi:hypothetical protein
MIALTSTHSILYCRNITFDWHSLPQECHWGIEQVLGMVTCNTVSCICVSWSLSYSTLFQSGLLLHLQGLCSIHSSALCSWVPLVGTWEHKALVWVRYKLWRWGNNLLCGVYYLKFLNFFPVWGKHSVNHGWLCSGEVVHHVCGHRPLLHQITMGLAQEWTPPR